MPRLFAVTLFALLSWTVGAQPVEEVSPVTPDAPVGTVSKTAEDGFSVVNFELSTANDLVIICSIGEAHPDYITARAFCVGYVTGALNYYRAIANGPGMGAFICSDRPIPRADLVTAFLAWSSANPQLASAPAVENLMRAAVDKWPCTG